MEIHDDGKEHVSLTDSMNSSSECTVLFNTARSDSLSSEAEHVSRFDLGTLRSVVILSVTCTS